jgi:L-lactate dehydrogenase (cytochrome)
VIAPGAYFCLVGRPMLYAASIGGLACVLHAIRLLREEIDRDMALIGVRRMAEVEPSLLRKMSRNN